MGEPGISLPLREIETVEFAIFESDVFIKYKLFFVTLQDSTG